MAVVDRVGGEDLIIENLDYSYDGNLTIFNDLGLMLKPENFCLLLALPAAGKPHY